MSLTIRQTALSGCLEITAKKFTDERGMFVKTFQRDMFAAHGLETSFAEDYYSYSRKGVLRGLHFQLPPHDHIKLVYCVAGKVMDVVLDVRLGSPTYGQHAIFELSAENAKMIYIPSGLAHGFYVPGDYAIMMYKAQTVYSPDHDTGIHWSSASIPWPDDSPIVSERDRKFLPLAEFKSPFRFFG